MGDDGEIEGVSARRVARRDRSSDRKRSRRHSFHGRREWGEGEARLDSGEARAHRAGQADARGDVRDGLGGWEGTGANGDGASARADAARGSRAHARGDDGGAGANLLLPGGSGSRASGEREAVAPVAAAGAGIATVMRANVR